MEKSMSSRTHRSGDPSKEYLVEAFQKGISQIMNDSILDCFKKSYESQEFMFDRMKEILTECLKEANNQNCQELESRLESANQKISSLDSQLREAKIAHEQILTFKGDSGHFSGSRHSASESRQEDVQRELEYMKEENKKLCNRIVSLTANQYKTESDDSMHHLSRNNEYLEEKLTLEKMVKSLKHKLAEVQDVNKNLQEVEKTLKLKLESKSRMIEEYKEKVMTLERDQKRVMYDKKESEELFDRKCKLLEEENQILHAKFNEMNNSYEKIGSDSEIRESLKVLETKYGEIKESSKAAGRRLEEAEFNNEQLRMTITALKAEIINLNEILSGERNGKYQLEIKMIEMRDKESTSRIEAADWKERHAKQTQEFNILAGNLKQAEEAVKLERKKAIELDRLNEQLAFSSSSNERALKERLESFGHKLRKSEEENEKIKEKMANSIKEYKVQLEEERKSNAKMAEKYTEYN
jgi:myosin protein heavy chain